LVTGRYSEGEKGEEVELDSVTKASGESRMIRWLFSLRDSVEEGQG
jgi:hypothetical protein